MPPYDESLPQTYRLHSSSPPSAVTYRRQTHSNASFTATKGVTNSMYCTNTSSMPSVSAFTNQVYTNNTLATQISSSSLPSPLNTLKFFHVFLSAKLTTDGHALFMHFTVFGPRNPDSVCSTIVVLQSRTTTPTDKRLLHKHHSNIPVTHMAST